MENGYYSTACDQLYPKFEGPDLRGPTVLQSRYMVYVYICINTDIHLTITTPSYLLSVYTYMYMYM